MCLCMCVYVFVMPFFCDFVISVCSSAQSARLLRGPACCCSECPPGGALSTSRWLNDQQFACLDWKTERQAVYSVGFCDCTCRCGSSPLRSVSWEVKGSLCCKKKKSRRLCCTVGRLDSCSGSSQLSFSTVYTVPPLYTRSAGDVETFMPK